jgi:hypothetical protein
MKENNRRNGLWVVAVGMIVYRLMSQIMRVWAMPILEIKIGG